MFEEERCKIEKPILTVDTLGALVIPDLRITHQGYGRLKDREILSLGIRCFEASDE